jgi:hypothetical protein
MPLVNQYIDQSFSRIDSVSIYQSKQTKGSIRAHSFRKRTSHVRVKSQVVTMKRALGNVGETS